MNIGIIAIAKQEELYIKEWLDYHLDKGFSRIIVADNDDTLVLAPYSSDKVIIEDYTGVEGVQSKAYTELFAKYKGDFDWILFLDVDEFFTTEDGRSVEEFISSLPQSVDMVRLNCVHFDDNDELDVVDGNYSVLTRFTNEVKTSKDTFMKTFLNCRTDIGEEKIYGHGVYNKRLSAINAEGVPCGSERRSKEMCRKVAWIRHYRTLTIGEYIRHKYFRGGANRNPYRYTAWRHYFSVTNKLTNEKVQYAERLINEMSRNQ